MHELLREGASVGVHLVIAGDRSCCPAGCRVLTEDKLVLRLTDQTDYSLAGLNPKKLPDEIAPGRGFRADGAVETQVALLDDDPSGQGQAAALRASRQPPENATADVPRADATVPRRRAAEPARFDDAWKLRDDDSRAAAVRPGRRRRRRAHRPLGPDLAAGTPTFLVAGPPKSGRSTVLLDDGQVVPGRRRRQRLIVAPRPSPLRDLAGIAGVAAVLTGDDLTEEELTAALDAGRVSPVALVIDDGELLRTARPSRPCATSSGRRADRGIGIVLGGNAEDVGGGFSGWQVDVRKDRQGALLCPQNITDGDLVGVRLARSSVGAPGSARPGAAPPR